MKIKTTLQILFAVLIANSVMAQTYDWTFQSTVQNENMQALKVTENGVAVLIGYGNTILNSIDGGTTWNDPGVLSNADDFDFQDISFSGNTGYAVSMASFKAVNRAANDLFVASPILKTTDGGDSWSIVSIDLMGSGEGDSLDLSLDGSYNQKFTAVECIDENIAYVGASWLDIDGVKHQNAFFTNDGGLTWVSLLPDQGNNGITSIEEFNGHVYIAGKEMLFKVNIQTNSVTDLYPIVDQGSDDAMYFWNITSFGSEIIFPTTSDSIRVSIDEGATFAVLPGVTGGNVVYKHNDSTYLVAGATSKTKATTDGGVTWSDCSAGETIWNGGVAGDSIVGLARNDIYKMAFSDIEVGNFVWNKTDLPEAESMLKAMDNKGDTVFIAGFADYIAASVDGAQSFTQVALPSKREMIYASVDIEFKGLGTGEGGSSIITSRRFKMQERGADDYFIPGFIFTTTDSWKTYVAVDDTKIGEIYGDVPDSNPYAAGCWGQDYFAAECINDSTFYVYVQWLDTSTVTKETHARVFKTSDSCVTWDTITPDLGSRYVTTISFKGNTGYIGGSNVFLKTTDAGESIIDLTSKIEALADDNIYISDINMVCGDTVFVTTTADGAFVTYDAGNSFERLNDPAGGNGIHVFDNDSWLTVGTSTRTFFTNNSGSDWEACYPGSTMFSRGVIIGDTLIACAKSGLWKLYVPGLDTDVSAGDNPVADQSGIIIYQNASGLNIVSVNEMESCDLININGQQAGNYSVNSKEFLLDASYLPEGVYVLRVSTADGIESHKVLLK